MANKTHILYYSTFCFFCQKVLMFMRREGIEIELRNTNEGQHQQALRLGGGKTQVPCLLIESGADQQWMYESDDIITYLKAQNS